MRRALRAARGDGRGDGRGDRRAILLRKLAAERGESLSRLRGVPAPGGAPQRGAESHGAHLGYRSAFAVALRVSLLSRIAQHAR